MNDTDQTTPGVVDEEGSLIVQVPNRRIARLVQLGVHAEREERRRVARRKEQRRARRKNRSK